MADMKHLSKPDRGAFLTYLRVAKECSRKDASAVLRVFSELRLADCENQLPCAHKILDFLIRLLSIKERNIKDYLFLF